METEKKLTTMEEELKLMKGELKQSLTSVRDYLLNMELPSSEFATVLAALGADGEQKITMKGSFSNDQGTEKPFREEGEETAESALEEVHEEEDLQPEAELPAEEEGPFNQDDGYTEEEASGDYLEQYPEDGETEEEEYLEPEAAPFAREETGEAEDQLMADAGLPAGEETPLTARGSIGAEINPSIPKVNLLANLMHWVTSAKKDIGVEQLPLFLEVYGISGHLSPDLKELILHMADIASDNAQDGNTAEIWSRTMLSLHGILTGGDAPLHPVKSFWQEAESETPEEEEPTETEPEQPEEAPFKLKLVLPTGNGQSQEFCLDLKPEVPTNGSEATTENRQPIKEGGDTPWQKPRKKR